MHDKLLQVREARQQKAENALKNRRSVCLHIAGQMKNQTILLNSLKQAILLLDQSDRQPPALQRLLLKSDARWNARLCLTQSMALVRQWNLLLQRQLKQAEQAVEAAKLEVFQINKSIEALTQIQKERSQQRVRLELFREEARTDDIAQPKPNSQGVFS